MLLRRNGQFEVVGAEEIRPWDTVIVPAAYGGLRAANWDPEAVETVADLGDAAQLRQRGRPMLRLDERLWPGAAPPLPPGDDTMDATEESEALQTFLATQGDRAPQETDDPDARGETIGLLLQEFAERRRPRLIRVAGRDRQDRWVLVSPHSKAPSRPVPGLTGPDLALGGDELSLIGQAATLSAHLNGVGKIAEGFAHRCGLAQPLVDDLRLAGELHDLGKHDRRFQQMLQGGSEYRMLTAPEPLAKSGLSVRDRRRREQARRRAGYPAGTRHELLSVALLRDAQAIRARAHDWDLVLHLVASHHGHCRPFAPVEPVPEAGAIGVEARLEGLTLTASTDHGLAALDSGISDRFFALMERYGCHGLAWLEAILRLADHRRSEQEEGGRR